MSKALEGREEQVLGDSRGQYQVCFWRVICQLYVQIYPWQHCILEFCMKIIIITDSVDGDNVGCNKVCKGYSQMLSHLVLTRKLSEINKSSHSHFTEEESGNLKG